MVLSVWGIVYLASCVAEKGINMCYQQCTSASHNYPELLYSVFILPQTKFECWNSSRLSGLAPLNLCNNFLRGTITKLNFTAISSDLSAIW